MKANNGSGNNELRDEWETPQWLIKELMKQYQFSLDCCATEDNKKAHYYSDCFTRVRDTSSDMCWMNPPFTKSKEMFEHFFKIVKRGVAIYRCDNMETKVWQDIILKNATWIFIPNKRIAYEGMEGNGSRFPSALIGLNVEKPNRLEGVALNPKKTQNG